MYIVFKKMNNGYISVIMINIILNGIIFDKNIVWMIFLILEFKIAYNRPELIRLNPLFHKSNPKESNKNNFLNWNFHYRISS